MPIHDWTRSSSRDVPLLPPAMDFRPRENMAVGDRLPDMPIFLTPDHYVPCPLEASYQVTWGVFPAALKGPLELSPK